MKKSITLLLCIISVIILAACNINTKTGNGSGSIQPENEAVIKKHETDCLAENPDSVDYGLNMTVKDVTNTGMTLVFAQSGGSPAGELRTGSEFSLERKEDGYWKPVETVIPEDEITWTMEVYEIAKGGMLEMGIVWTGIYGELESGVYRVRKPIMDYKGPGDYDTNSLWQEFEIG